MCLFKEIKQKNMDKWKLVLNHDYLNNEVI